MIVQSYASPLAFKQALEQRLKSASNSGVDFARRRQLLVFDRLLARIVRVFGDAAVLKCRISSVGDHPVSSVEDHLIS
jgi:hypothetical protein